MIQRRILITEDDNAVREFVNRALQMDGHQTTTACDGGEGLEVLRQNKGDFDLLLTDIKMPVMDGIELALTAGEEFPDLTILLMTGFADQRERAKGLDAVVFDVINKPFTLQDIRSKVKDALSHSKAL